MAQIAAGALALGIGVEHFRPNLPPALLSTSLMGGGTKEGVAMFGTGAVVVAAYMYPVPVAPLTFMLS
jgi:hypothetical protein